MNIIWVLFKQNKFVNLINIFAAALFYLLLLSLLINMNQASIEVGTSYHFKDKNIYQISDDLVNEKEVEFFSKPSNYDMLNEFANAMANSRDFQYFNAIWQPISVFNFKGDEIFGAYYESGTKLPERKVNGKNYMSIKSMQINQNVFDVNHIQLGSGRIFYQEEYILRNNHLPVILGAAYKDIYKPGDRIEIQYYFQDFIGTVVGILQPSQKIVTAMRPEIILDRYMILPAMYFSDPPSRLTNNASKYPIFFRASLLARINGTIISELNPLEIRGIVDDIASETGFNLFRIIGADGARINALIRMTETNRSTLIAISFILFMITLMVILSTLFIKIRNNIDTYKVLLISGANLGNIRRMVGYQFVITNLVGCVAPFLMLSLMVRIPLTVSLNYLLLAMLLSLVLSSIINVFTKKMFKDIDIVQKLKG